MRLEGATHWRSAASEVSLVPIPFICTPTYPAEGWNGSLHNLGGHGRWSGLTGERQFEEAWCYVGGSDPQWEARYQRIMGHEALLPSLPGSNFPFGTIFTFSQSRVQILESLPPPQVVTGLVQAYFDTFESTHRLLHRLEFAEELNTLWINNNQLSEAWLAQLCMVLALGCQTAPGPVLASTGHSPDDWTDIFLDAAQFFFSQSQYFTAPTLTTLRTLCLAAMARMMEIDKGAESKQLVYFMGLVTRMAMAMNLHRTSSLFPDMTPFEAEMRKRVWVTVQLLDLDAAMRTGTSFLHREQDADTPLDINDTDFHRSEHGWVVHPRWAAPGGLTDSTYQVKLAELIPVLTDVICFVNSPTPVILDNDRLRSWDSRLKQKLQEAESALARQPQGLERSVSTQIHFLRVLVHRTLLALHSYYIRTTRTGQVRDSTLAAMLSALALLRTQHAWHSPPSRATGAAGVQTRASSSSTATAMYQPLEEQTPPLTWLSDLCHDDFEVAMFHLVLVLRRGDLDAAAKQGNLPTRARASVILRQSLEFKRARACRSVSHFGEFVRLSLAVRCLASFEAGEPMLAGLMEVADQIEQTAIQGSRQGLLWTQGSNPLFAGQAGMPTGQFVFGYGQ